MKTYLTLNEDELHKVYQKAEETNIDLIILELERRKDGSTVHNINKAILYLHYFTNFPNGSLKRFPGNGKYDRLRELKMFCLCYLDHGDFQQLGKSMQGWI